MKNCSQVLEETNKIGLSALLIAIRTGQHDVRSTVTIAIIIIVIVIIIFIISNYSQSFVNFDFAMSWTVSAQCLPTNRSKQYEPHNANHTKNQVVSLLLDSGANPDSRDRDGESAVHVAVREEDYNMLQILLKVHFNLSGSLAHFQQHLGQGT